MPIVVCGLNHKTADVGLREQVYFAPEKLGLYLTDIISHNAIHEAVILSTCNRSEVYCHADDAEVVLDWFVEQHSNSHSQFKNALYLYENTQAVSHIMRVASGLDSMVIGEPEILGQMKLAFGESSANAGLNTLFNRLFQTVFSVAKEVRSSTSIGACPVSVASSSVNLIKTLKTNYTYLNYLIIGAGSTSELLIKHLKRNGVKSITLLNRNYENALRLANQLDLNVNYFQQLECELLKSDVVITATGSTSYVITPALFSKHRNTPLTLIDIAVPRNIDPAVANFDFVDLYCIDDLKEIIHKNINGRVHAAQKAEEIIEKKSLEFTAWMQSFDKVSQTIRSYRKQVEAICQGELEKALLQLNKGEDPAHVLNRFADLFMNKLLHAPSVQLRKIGLEGRLDILEVAQQLLINT